MNSNDLNINLLVERIITEINLNDYSDEDFIEVFFTKFRPWVKQNHGDEVGAYPMSLLVKTYLDEFCDKLGIRARGYGGTAQRMAYAGREMVEKNLHKLPSLGKKEKFTEKYKKGIELLVKNLDLPSFVKLQFEEDRPYEVYCKVIVDFDEFIKSSLDNNEYRNLVSIESQLRKSFENFLGVTFGNPSHGQLKFHCYSDPEMVGEEKWIKTVLNKQIKKEIKQLPNGNGIHSMKYERNKFKIELKLRFSSYVRWENKRNILNAARELVRNLGYSSTIFELTD